MAIVVFGCIALTALGHQFRLTETSITENGRIHALPEVRLVTKGYGLFYIHDTGLGLGYTSLATRSNKATDSVQIDHRYLDMSYSFGDLWRGTFGYGVGVGGQAKVSDATVSSISSTSYHLGVGLFWNSLEVMWINRLNYPRFSLLSRDYQMTSSHYQLALGYRF